MEKSEPVTTQLSWQPEFADISSAADLGFTTGPWEFRRTPQESPAAYGHYVTVWKKPAGGAWKIAVDLGIAYMNAPKRRDVETPKLKSDVTNSLPEAEIQKARDELQALENRFPATTDAYVAMFGDGARLYRNDSFPIVGRPSIRKAIAQAGGPLMWKVLHVDVARSGDLGFAYGSLESANYLRIWKKQNTRDWKVVLDLVTAPSQATIQDLSWIAGDWESVLGDVHIDEHWTGVAGGSMLGMSRTVSGARTVSFEYLRIETRPDGIYYVAHPRAKSPGTDFKLVRSDRGQAVFENPSHDFPKRIIYRLNTDGSLTARVEGDGSEKEKAQDFHYRPVKRN